MIDARYKNNAGWTFILWAGNPYAEVYRPMDLKGKLSEAIPYEVIHVGLGSGESALKRIGSEWSDYARKA